MELIVRVVTGRVGLLGIFVLCHYWGLGLEPGMGIQRVKCPPGSAPLFITRFPSWFTSARWPKCLSGIREFYALTLVHVFSVPVVLRGFFNGMCPESALQVHEGSTSWECLIRKPVLLPELFIPTLYSLPFPKSISSFRHPGPSSTDALSSCQFGRGTHTTTWVALPPRYPSVIATGSGSLWVGMLFRPGMGSN